MNVLMQLDLQAQIRQLLLAQLQVLQQQECSGSTATTSYRQQLLHAETLKGLVLQQQMVQHLSAVVSIDGVRIQSSCVDLHETLHQAAASQHAPGG